MYADFAAREEIVKLLPRWPVEQLPKEFVPWTRGTYKSSDDDLYRCGDALGEGTAGKVFELDRVGAAGRGPKHVVLKRMKHGEILEDEILRISAAGVDAGHVKNKHELVMRRGMDLNTLLCLVSLKMDEVMALLTAVLDIQSYLIHQKNCVYTDVKVANVILFQSPETSDSIRVSFCDYGGLHVLTPEMDLTGVSTFPPPETKYDGFLKSNNDMCWALSAAVWWCGVLFIEMYQFIKFEYFVYSRGDKKDKSLEERSEHLEFLRRQLCRRGLNNISLALSPDWKERINWTSSH